MLAKAEAVGVVPPLFERRVAALVLPALLCELAEAPRGVPRGAVKSSSARHRPEKSSTQSSATSLKPGEPLPLGVVLLEKTGSDEEVVSTSILSAVNDAALRLGVRAGQTLAEARVLASRLLVRRVPQAALDTGLGSIAEIALGFGATVAFSAPDTVWVDVTGAAHLFGGEAGLMAELVARVREAGHRVRAALAGGPRLAQAFARFGDLGKEGYALVSAAHTRRELGRLPVRALGLPSSIESWLIRLGVLTLAALDELPKGALAARLEAQANSVFELLSGRDSTPLVAYTPPRSVVEEISWDEPAAGSEPLLFALRGLSSRLGARLSGRGEAARALVLDIKADATIARFRGAPLSTRLEFLLPKPLWKSEELNRIVASKLERVTLEAPSLGLRLEVTELDEAMPRQLELGLWGASISGAIDELPLVLAELTADLGEERVGVLNLVEAHRPELASELVPALPPAKPRLKKTRRVKSVRIAKPEGADGLVHRLTRLLPQPVPFDAPLRKGVTLALGRRLYTIESLRFEQRLEAVEWWAGAVNRDYVSVGLRGADGVIEGLVYVERESGKRYWQGVVD
jgi:protein ImuB